MKKLAKTKDFLIRNMPIEVYNMLEKFAHINHRSKTQEAIVALTKGLSMNYSILEEPVPYKWEKKMTNKFIQDAIDEGRE